MPMWSFRTTFSHTSARSPTFATSTTSSINPAVRPAYTAQSVALPLSKRLRLTTALLALSACGNKGALVMPDKPASPAG